MINVLNATELFNKPLLYSTFLLWLMSELYENLPEVGDLDKPKIVFFFDEAHLLFNDAPAFLIEKIDQIVRLIRSKGVGVYFISQSPSDIPDNILAQLQNRVQHALRAYTPAEQKKLKAAAASFRANPDFDTEAALSELAVGEALVSFLDAKGTPGVVERAFILPPQSFIGSAGFEKIQELTEANPLYEKYRLAVDPESAYELLMKKYDPNFGAPAAPAYEAAPVAEAAPAAAAVAPVAAAPAVDPKEEEKARLAAEKQAEKDRAAEIREDREADRKQRELDRQEDRERRIEEKERAAEIREQKERDRQEDRERREEERQARAEERARKEAERQEEKAKREAERAKKNSPVTKMVNSATTAAGRQIGSSLIRGIFGSLLKKK